MSERELLALLGLVYEADVYATKRDVRTVRARLGLATRMLVEALTELRRRQS
jgi:hypothetical protein